MKAGLRIGDMTKILYAIAIFLIVGGLAYHFAALQVFNILVPKDAGSNLVAADVAYGAAPQQKLDVYAPLEDEAQEPMPVVVFVHGGSWNSGNKDGYEFVGRALAAQGLLALVINYRLTDDAPYPAFLEDTARALDWATRRAGDYGGDPTRVFAMGHSAGAYNIAQAILDKRYLLALGNDGAAVKGVVTLAGPFDFLPLDTRVTKATFGQQPDLASTQPVNFARADAPPFLILHGSADTTVFPRNAVALDKALRLAGANSTLKIYNGISHAGIMLAMSMSLRSRATVLNDAATFFKSK
jgi:acetyl esterase/lipase